MPFPDHLQNRLGQIAEALDLNATEMTILRMRPGIDDRHKELELLQGSWDEERPWVIIDENDHPHTMTSAQALSKMIAMLASAQGESFQLKLEKAIWQRYPIDFHDVWAVAMDRIKRQAQSQAKSTVVKIDLDWLVSEIKQEFPNLFYHLDQILTQKEK
jgi:predicted amidohydrolase